MKATLGEAGCCSKIFMQTPSSSDVDVLFLSGALGLQSASTNLGPGSFERYFRSGFNGNNGAFQYPNPENPICSNLDSIVLIFTVTCMGMFADTGAKLLQMRR